MWVREGVGDLRSYFPRSPISSSPLYNVCIRITEVGRKSAVVRFGHWLTSRAYLGRHVTFPVTALSLTRPAVARVFSCAYSSDRAHFLVGAGTASVSGAAVHLRHPQLLSPSRSSTRCCPPVISSIINDHDEFFDLPVREAGSLINQPVTFAP
jgi:hypothetical protein